jgi:hypothetical protein
MTWRFAGKPSSNRYVLRSPSDQLTGFSKVVLFTEEVVIQKAVSGVNADSFFICHIPFFSETTLTGIH